jgi:hypothetical protein
MMERLTIRTRYGAKFKELPPYLNKPDKNKLLSEAAERLAQYEDAEQEGRLIRLPVKVGDTVYVIADCVDVLKTYDDDYFSGTGAIECPFDKDCRFEECDDSNRRVFETSCHGIWIIGEDGKLSIFVDYLNVDIGSHNIGKTVFLTREEAEKALKGDAK